MTVKDLDDLATAIGVAIPDNTTRLVDPADIRDTGFVDSIDSIGRINATRFGMKGDDSTVNTTFLQAGLDSGLGSLYVPAGIYITDSVTLSADDFVLFGEGTIRLINNATGMADRGMIHVTGSRCTVRDLTLKGNLVAAPSSSADLGSPLVIVGDECRVTNVRLFDARADAPAVPTRQDNIRVIGKDCIVSNCHSENSGYSGYMNGGPDSSNQFVNNYFRRGPAPFSAIIRAFNNGGGSDNDGVSLVIDGLNADKDVVIDWTSMNNPALVENVIVKNCFIKSVGGNGIKLAHIRNVFIDNCHIEADVSFPGLEGVVFAERVYNATITNSFISSSGGSTSSSSHFQHFSAGSKHTSLNSLTLDNCIIGGTGRDPSDLWDLKAVCVRTFKFTMKDCIVNSVRNRVIECWPETDGGVVSIGLNTPPATTGSQDVYIVGTAPTGDWAGQANALAWDISVGTWLFESITDVPATLKYDTRVFDFDTRDWYKFINAADGWVVVPDEEWGYNVTGNTFVGYQDGAGIFGVDMANDEAVIDRDLLRDRLLKRSDLIRFYDNEIVNHGIGGTAETNVANLDSIYQQKASGLWFNDAIPADGIWSLGDRIDRVPGVVGQPVGWICTTAGGPGVFAFTALPDL